MDREQKREFVAGLARVFAETSMVVVTRNQGLTVAEATDLRRRMRAAGATYRVAKNRLATRALEGTKFASLLGLIAAPATKVAGTVQASAGQLARVFGAYARKAEQGAAG